MAKPGYEIQNPSLPNIWSGLVYYNPWPEGVGSPLLGGRTEGENVTINLNVRKVHNLCVYVQGFGSVEVTDGATGDADTVTDHDHFQYPEGTQVDLEASANTNHVFIHWQGAGIDGLESETAEITMDDSKGVAAVFHPKPTGESTSWKKEEKHFFQPLGSGGIPAHWGDEFSHQLLPLSIDFSGFKVREELTYSDSSNPDFPYKKMELKKGGWNIIAGNWRHTTDKHIIAFGNDESIYDAVPDEGWIEVIQKMYIDIKGREVEYATHVIRFTVYIDENDERCTSVTKSGKSCDD